VSAATGTSRRAWGWHRLDHEWAARIVAQAGIRPGRARGFRVSMGAPVPRRAFHPPPRVDSAVLVVRRL